MAQKPPYAPNVQNQTVSYGGATWKGNPGSDWTMEGSSSSGFQMPDFGSLFSSQKSELDAQNKGYATQENDFLNRFRTAISGQEALPAMADRIGNELGLPNLRNTAFQLNQSLAKIPSVQTQATRGFDVNQNQLDRLIAHKQGQLAPSAQQATAQQQFAEGQLSERLGYAGQEQLKQLKPFETESSMMSDRISREVTGYSQLRQNELDSLLAKLQTGAQLSIAEQNRAQQLALQEREFNNQKELVKYKYDLDPLGLAG